jgi:serine/threonine-protein kinase
MFDAATPSMATHATEAGNGILRRYGIIGVVHAARRAGRYTLGAKIGSGGSADVFEAHAEGAEGFAKQLVVKRIRTDLLDEPEAVALLRKEASLAQGLQHGNIVQVFDYGEDDGAPYIVMERVDGCSLRALLRHLESQDLPLPLADAVSIVEQVADALHYMHRFTPPAQSTAGLVHRDVKPENILLSRRGVVKLTDFGITKARALPTETAPGFVKGTPRYLAPEQAAGRSLDGRADIYALGTVFRELCDAAGDDGPTEILALATELSPEARYETALELRTALERWRVERGLRIDPDRLAALVQRATPKTKKVVSLDAALGGLPTQPEAPATPTAAPDRTRMPMVLLAAGALFAAAAFALWPRPASPPPTAPTPSVDASEPPLPEPLPKSPPPPAPTAQVEPSIAPPPTSAESAKSSAPRPTRAKAGSLRINVLPYATVRIDGKDYGQTPVTATLASGKHRVVLENPQTGKTVRGTVVVSPSKTTAIKTWDALQ